MARDIYDAGGLVVTRLVGPAGEGADRRRWQITAPLPAGTVTLREPEIVTLALALLHDVAGAGANDPA